MSRDFCDCLGLSDLDARCEVARRGAVLIITHDLKRFVECISMDYFVALVSRFYLFDGLSDEVCGDLDRVPVGEGGFGGVYCEVMRAGKYELGRIVDWG